MIKVKTLLAPALSLSALLLLSACQNDFSRPNDPALIAAQDQEGNAKLSITRVDELLNAASSSARQGPNFTGILAEPFASNKAFKKTPMGAYLQTWLPNTPNKEQIDKVIPQIITQLYESVTCKHSCNEEFLRELSADRSRIESRLIAVSSDIAKNELKNHNNFNVFYHSFPNDFRLYQDVLRALKSFEYLTKLKTTYPLRDFSFNNAKVTLPSFLEEWWPEYLKYAERQKVPPYPTVGYKAMAKNVGLSFYPDAIPYAAHHILSANVNFIGNNLDPKNSSVFFFLNSIATSASKFELVEKLIKKSLSPYVLSADGQADEAKLSTIVANLKTIFDRAMAKTGGQVAQIFVEKNAVPKVSFMSWDGGEPLWISKKTGKIIQEAGKSFMPPNVFWPTEEQKSEYQLFSVVDFMNLYVNDPAWLSEVFPIKRKRWAFQAAKLLDIDVNDPRVPIFNSQDYAQARVLPNPQYFTDERVTGVKIFTRNPISQQEELSYDQEIFNVLRDVIADFLATAKESNFKEGSYKLKSAFIDAEAKSREKTGK